MRTSNGMENTNTTHNKQNILTSVNAVPEERFESSTVEQSTGQVIDNNVTSTGTISASEEVHDKEKHLVDMVILSTYQKALTFH